MAKEVGQAVKEDVHRGGLFGSVKPACVPEETIKTHKFTQTRIEFGSSFNIRYAHVYS